MREVVYHRIAVRLMRRMPAARKEQVKQALTEIAALENLNPADKWGIVSKSVPSQSYILAFFWNRLEIAVDVH